MNKATIIEAFLKWLKNDLHKKDEDYYKDTMHYEYLSNLSKEEFIEYFFQFAREGGKVQSLGWRTAGKFKENVIVHYDEFRTKILDIFSDGFNVFKWLEWVDSFKNFGPGLSTIILNRIDKTKFAIVNNKSYEGLQKLGYNLSSRNLPEKYNSILEAEKSLLKEFPVLDNFFRVDYMMHFIIGTEEGKAILEESLQSAKKVKLLDLKGNRLYKISHGVFIKRPQFVKAGLLDILEKNNWISMGLDTGKGQATEFIENAQIGDYVYICYGGNEVYCVGKIVSESKPFDKIKNEGLDNEEEWIYREIEPLFFSEVRSVNELKEDKRSFMPSGNSTFWEVPKDQLEYINEKIFIPKFNFKVVVKTNDKNSPETNSGYPEALSQKKPLNTILYGPPGTGKTYHCVTHAVAIIEGKAVEEVCNEDRKEVKSRFEQYRKEGQIVFTTFHQSLGYEDFIEGIKPVEPGSEEEQLTYAVEDGIFKKLSNEASFSFVNKTTKTETEHVLDFSKEYDRFIDAVNEKLSKGETTDIPTRSGGKIQIESISQKNNIWVSHIDGTRNYTVSKKRLSQLSKAFPDLSEITNIYDQFRAEIGGSNASAYWAILNAIRKQSSKYPENEEMNETKYSYEDKKQFIETLVNQDYMAENPKQFVLIIDEINRGNVSQVFGELITLIEDDKRMGKNEALKITLPYSKEEFGVPCNLHIIGTMNTADRSVEALDSALRRRFSFIEINPKPEELNVTMDGINLTKMLEVLNRRLAVLKDNDHTIGHAWLWNVTNFMELKEVFGNKILPLLKEYFYNDYEKLGLVLGDAFFKIKEQVNSKMFASFSGGNSLAVQYDQAWQYQLKSIDELTVSDFKSLEIQDTETESTNV
jgi:Cdc6-like AAA superfamily ATPase